MLGLIKGMWILLESQVRVLNVDSLVTYFLLWGIPGVMVMRGFIKMVKEDKQSLIKEFTSWKCISTLGFIMLGSFLAHIGSLLAISAVKIMGISCFTIGGIVATIAIWKVSKARSLVIFTLVSISLYIKVM